jgi:hypothetical protein
MFALEARYVGWKMPVVKRTPVELSDSSIMQGSARKLSYFGYDFEVPWEIDEAKTKQAGKMQLVAFRSGNALLVSSMAPKQFVSTFLSSDKADQPGLRGLYGEDILQSDYLLKRAILEATPDKVGLLTPRKDAVGIAMLLITKGVIMPRGAETGIFRIRTGNFEGFQYGDPHGRPNSIDIQLFADDGGLAFLFTQQEKGAEPAISQAEINRVLQSLRKSTNPN